ncbi:MAG: sulfate adenylyltransferase subunit CysN [Gammaproteobacteria bacterium]|nr:sulfate adenylyltransferase subunit CysN [Gammaproteobacteria bacterium]
MSDLLRFITCGSVDDGKSTLIGRLLYESRQVLDDQLAALEADSKKWGTQGEAIDFALLVDGLSAEREQGITIDVAYRFFSTPRRKFIVADTPGHEQYTRNMVTGASTAELALILVDARKGVLTQTRRHSYLVSLMGIRRVVLAVNKMDLVDYSQDDFDRIVADYREFAQRIGLTEIIAIPISALGGDNVVTHGARMRWYRGPTLLSHLETVEIEVSQQIDRSLRLPVQWVNRPSPDFRGYSGLVTSGVLRVGDRVRIQPSGRQTQIARIVTADGDLVEAAAGRSITVTLTDDVDVMRGDVISAATDPAEIADQFETTLVWLGDEPMLSGRSYLLKIGARTMGAVFSTPKHKVNVNTLELLAARQLELNEIGTCNVALDQPVAFEPYELDRAMGGFVVIDRLSHATVGAGMIRFALRRSRNIHRQVVSVDKATRAALKRQKPVVVWFTGLSGSGKSTIANALEQRLLARGCHSYLLDGDNVRHGLNRDLGFTAADRVENIRRIAEVAKLLVDSGLIVLTAFISPYRAERDMARQLLEEGEFIEVYVDTPLEVAEARDAKGLYRKVRRGELKNFTGIDAPYEAPQSPELRINTVDCTADEAAERVLALLEARGILAAGG